MTVNPKLIQAAGRLPDRPGVYCFKRGQEYLYIGKAASLRDRVRSYFNAELKTSRGPRLLAMLKEARGLDFFPSDSMLEAFFLEAEWLQKYQPRYNVEGKDDKSFWHLIITKEKFPRVLAVRGRERGGFTPAAVFGPFPRANELKTALLIIRKIFPFRDHCRPGAKYPCFEAEIGLCPGVCAGTITSAEYQKTIRRLRTLFAGRKVAAISHLEREMKEAARREDFEKAARLRNQIFSLRHIRDVSLLTGPAEDRLGEKDCGFRIEAYDVAHLGGRSEVGVMTVWQDGRLDKKSYRKFRLAAGADDYANLAAILRRRSGHEEWPAPDLVVVDGGRGQFNVARRILAARFPRTAVVAVTKDERHRPREIQGDPVLIAKRRQVILLVNHEAHRFALNYHRSRRRLVG